MNELTLVDLIDQLHRLTPMPSDKEIEYLYIDEGIDVTSAYYEVVSRIAQVKNDMTPNDSKSIVTALIRTFGIDEGFEVYWNALHTIELFPADIIYPIIRAGCQGTQAGSRKWCCLLLARLRDPDDIPLIVRNLKHPITQVRSQALMCLGYYPVFQVIKDYKPQLMTLLNDEDEDIQKAAIEFLSKDIS